MSTLNSSWCRCRDWETHSSLWSCCLVTQLVLEPCLSGQSLEFTHYVGGAGNQDKPTRKESVCAFLVAQRFIQEKAYKMCKWK